ncbi:MULTISPECIES: hypothetical protein [Spirulina sp. CCY15215]|nr:hypothetical protein [Spirulina major]
MRGDRDRLMHKFIDRYKITHPETLSVVGSWVTFSSFIFDSVPFRQASW